MTAMCLAPLLLGVGFSLPSLTGGAKSGAVHWQVSARAHGTPAVDERSAYFLSDHRDVVAVDTRTGAVLWRRGVTEAGSVSGSTLLVGSRFLVVGAYDLLAFDRRTGELEWRFVPPDGYGAGLYAGVIADGTVVTGSPAGRLYGVSEATGRMRWSSVVSEAAKSTVFEPIVNHNTAFAGFTTFSSPPVGGVVAVNLRNGSRKWRMLFPRSEDVVRSSAFAGGIVAMRDVVIAADATGAIYALDSSTGAIHWTLPPVAKARQLDYRALVGWKNCLIAASLSGVLVSYDMSSGRERWRRDHREDGSMTFRLAADAEVIYVPHLSGRLVAIDADSGYERWRVGDPSQRFTSSPRVFGWYLYATSTSGLFAFQR